MVKMYPFLKELFWKVYITSSNLWMGFIALIFGVQLKIGHLLWLRKRERLRAKDFRKLGYYEFQLMNECDWEAFSQVVHDYFVDFGTVNESKVEWALNKRVYLNIDDTPEVRSIVDQIIASGRFNNVVSTILGSADWSLFSTQIWRNYPEDFSNRSKEINSSFYHVDNGGGKENRLFVNIFMYLSRIDELNGPFTFYGKETSHRINRYFFTRIIKFGNLRKYHITGEIERNFKPKLLLKSRGSAIAINNQECLHRAGFCSRGHRDIIEFIISVN